MSDVWWVHPTLHDRTLIVKFYNSPRFRLHCMQHNKCTTNEAQSSSLPSSVLFCTTLFYFVLLCSALVCRALLFSALFCSILYALLCLALICPLPSCSAKLCQLVGLMADQLASVGIIAFVSRTTLQLFDSTYVLPRLQISDAVDHLSLRNSLHPSSRGISSQHNHIFNKTFTAAPFMLMYSCSLADLSLRSIPRSRR